MPMALTATSRRRFVEAARLRLYLRGRHLLDEKVLERLANRLRRRPAHRGRDLGDEAIGRRIERQLARVAAFAQAHQAPARRFEHPHERIADVRDDELPAVDLECQHVGQAPRGDKAAPGQNRHPAAQCLRVAEHVRTEKHRAAAIAEPQNQRAHVAPAQRIQARHRLVEDDELRIVDKGLRDADALQHALRELPELQPPFGADTDVIEQLACATPALGAAVPKSAQSMGAVPRRSGSRRSRDFPAGTDALLGGQVAEWLPSSSAVPLVGYTSCMSSLSVVVLPAPFGPRKPNTSPASTSSVS